MQAPAFLPPELLVYFSYFKTEKELQDALIMRPIDLVRFFEAACADEPWAEAHPKLMRELLRWSTRTFYLGELPPPLVQRLVKSIQAHFSLLQPWLFFKAAPFYTMTLYLNEKTIVVNSLLFGGCSSYFKDLFRVNYFEKLSNEWTMSTSLDLFESVHTHILKGTVENLWRLDYNEILNLMHLSRQWDLLLLVKECASILRRYINKENVVETLLKAHRQFFLEWKNDCIEVFNHQDWALKLIVGKVEDLRVEVLNFKQETLELFYLLAPWITHLGFGAQLSESSFYLDLITRCPKLKGIDLTDSFQYTDQFEALPSRISEINLSACAWLADENILMLARQLPQLRVLHLAGNVQLNYQSFGLLMRFKHLIHLNLANCTQLTDEILKLISETCPHLINLDLKECRLLGDRGCIEMIHNCPHLEVLDLSRCPITNRTLSELGAHAFRLTHLMLVGCSNLTDHALWQMLYQRPALKLLNVKECSFTVSILNNIKNHFSLLELID
jgi:hypothetical protein